MPVYEKIDQTTQRALVNSSELNLRFDLSKEFCSAAWHALNEPIEAVMSATGQPEYRGLQGPARNVHLTEPLVKNFSDVVSRALHSEAKRTGTEYPEVLFEGNNMERLIAGCVNHMHGAVAHRYAPKRNFDD
jgi:hypothetical protein